MKVVTFIFYFQKPTTLTHQGRIHPSLISFRHHTYICADGARNLPVSKKEHVSGDLSPPPPTQPVVDIMYCGF